MEHKKVMLHNMLRSAGQYSTHFKPTRGSASINYIIANPSQIHHSINLHEWTIWDHKFMSTEASLHLSFNGNNNLPSAGI